MLKQEFLLKSPIRILQKATQGGLGRGDLGVFMARAGVGKTACLVHVALDSLFRDEKVLHVGIGETMEKVQVWYKELLMDLTKVHGLKDSRALQEQIDRNRVILAYTRETFSVSRLAQDIRDLSEKAAFEPRVLLIDGFNFQKEESPRERLTALESMAKERGMAVWFSAQTHRDSDTVNLRGIPAPCHEVDDLFSVMIVLEPQPDSIHLKLVKAYDVSVTGNLPIQLNPSTLLLMDGSLSSEP